MTAAGTVGPVDLRPSLDVVDGLPVLALSGTVDLATVPILQDGLVRLLADHPGASAWPSTSTASTPRRHRLSACCSAPPGGPARPAATSSSCARASGCGHASPSPGSIAPSSIAGGIAELLTA